jgi:hypothetical protein
VLTTERRHGPFGKNCVNYMRLNSKPFLAGDPFGGTDQAWEYAAHIDEVRGGQHLHNVGREAIQAWLVPAEETNGGVGYRRCRGGGNDGLYTNGRVLPTPSGDL